MTNFINSSEIIKKIAEIARKTGTEAFLVGGYVRDKILGKVKTDIDITVLGDATEFAALTAKELGKKLSAVYKKFGTALLEVNESKIEFASARKESYRSNSRKPDIEFAVLKEDLSRRDFTVNALAVSLNDDKNEIIDLFNGIEDLKNKLLRTPLDPFKTFNDDPLRMMRACRFASQLGFIIEDSTFEAIKEMRIRLKVNNDSTGVVSQERITDEFFKILASEKPSIGLALMFKSGLMEILFPELHMLEGVDQRRDFHHKDVFYHTLQVVDNISQKTENIWLKFAALMHDIAKPVTRKFIEGTGWTFHGHEELGARWQKKIFGKLRLPFDKLPYVEKLVRLHLRPIALAEENVTDSAIRRLIFEAGDDINDLLTLCRADITSKDPGKVKKYLENFDRVEKRIAEVEERDKIRNFQSPVKGEEIMKICNLMPSREVGVIKKKIEEAILDGIIPNEYEAALTYLYKIKDEVLKR
ncbi:MAG: CCA tRNA nucleotidyltransferase [Chlorobi bacterium]|nr:CCA tRNA nucleotidyltransferase [Chlorobiota bacterium]MCI0715013.1 CCA tRNA nucleotidyltransferase [Chlorobiota bacterium]